MAEWSWPDNLLEEMRRLVSEALQALDVRNLVLGIHDPSFPDHLPGQLWYPFRRPAKEAAPAEGGGDHQPAA